VTTPWRKRVRQRNTLFVILSAPRTGSTFVCDLLDSHPNIICHSELFKVNSVLPADSTPLPWYLANRWLRDIAPLFFLHLVWHKSSDAKAVGFKLFKGHDKRILRYILKHPEIKAVLLTRENVIRQYTSYMLAKRSHVFHSFHGDYKAQSITINLDHFWRWTTKQQSFFKEVRDEMHERGRELHELTYEQVTSDGDEPDALLSFLGIEPNAELSSRLTKLNKKPLSETVKNDEELKQELTGTKYEHLLD